MKYEFQVRMQQRHLKAIVAHLDIGRDGIRGVVSRCARMRRHNRKGIGYERESNSRLSAERDCSA